MQQWYWFSGLVAMAIWLAARERTPAQNKLFYTPIIKAAAADADMPYPLLLKIAEIESGFRSDIIEGKTVSSAGAVGIMQIIPRWQRPVVNVRGAGRAGRADR